MKAIRDSDRKKLFYELFACNHIKLLCLPEGIDFKKSESPDFISSDGEIGLEVVRSKEQKWEQLDAIVGKHFNKGLSAKEIKERVEKECKHGFEGSIISIKGVAAYSPVKEGIFDTSLLANRVIEVIIEKTKLLKSYQSCLKYWLYVFTETSLIDEFEIERINNVYQSIKCCKYYERIYILVPPKIYTLRFGEKPFSLDFTDEINKDISNVAKAESGLI